MHQMRRESALNARSSIYPLHRITHTRGIEKIALHLITDSIFSPHLAAPSVYPFFNRSPGSLQTWTTPTAAFHARYRRASS